MSVRPRPSRPSRHKPRPRSRPRLLLPASPPYASPPSSPQPPAPLSPSSRQVQVKWEPGLVRLEDLVQEYPLPQLVQCHSKGLQPRDGGHLAVPLDRPILLAEQRTVRHLLARIVHYDHRSGAFNESTDSVVIPEDYEGNFLRLQSRTTKDKTKVKSLEAIAHDDTPAFLNLANITSFPAHQRDPDDKSRFIYTVGNVFLVDEPLPPEPKDVTKSEEGGNNAHSHSVVSDSSRHKSASSSSSGRNSNGLMKCLDERGMPIMVPTNQVGEMVTVQGGGEGQARLSVKSRDMMVNQQFPLLTRYAYGKKHPRLTGFTKLLTLLDSFQETSIIACILNTSSLMLVEIPLTSSLSFRVAANLQDLLKVPHVRRAAEACRAQGRELARDIKFKYKFSHRVQENSRRMMKKSEEDDLPSATVRSRLVVTETYVYI